MPTHFLFKSQIVLLAVFFAASTALQAHAKLNDKAYKAMEDLFSSTAEITTQWESCGLDPKAVQPHVTHAEAFAKTLGASPADIQHFKAIRAQKVQVLKAKYGVHPEICVEKDKKEMIKINQQAIQDNVKNLVWIKKLMKENGAKGKDAAP